MAPDPADPVPVPVAVHGRTAELAVLAKALAAAAEGEVALTWIEGAPGMGKSALLERLGREATARGLRVLPVPVAPDDTDTPFGPLIAALVAAEFVDRKEADTLRRLQPQRYLFVTELGAVLERASARNPLLVVVDDAQWADQASVEAIRVLSTTGVAGASTAWVLAFRPRHASIPLARLCREWSDAKASAVLLGPLADHAVGRLLADRLGRVELTAAEAALIHQAQGVPFLLVECVRGLLAEPTRRGGGPGDAALPEATAISLDARIRRLAPQAQHVARVGAALGRWFRADDAAAMLDTAPGALVPAFEELTRAGVLGVDGARWRFRHDLVRQAVLEAMARPMRQALERHAADVLLRAGLAPVDVARRVAAGATEGDTRAVATLLAAAGALLTTEPSTAASFAGSALGLCRIGDPARVTAASLAAIGWHLAGRDDDAVRVADEALADAGDPAAFAELQLSVAKMYSLGAWTRIGAARRALERPETPDRLRARHLAVLVLSQTVAGDLPAAEAVAEQAHRAVARLGGDTPAELALEFSLMTMDEATARYSQALDRVPRIRRLAHETGEAAPALGAEWLRANVLVATDELERAWEVAAAGARDARRDAQGWIAARWEFWQGWFLLQRGRLSEARAVLEGALDTDGLTEVLALPDAVGVAALARIARHLGDERLLTRCRRIAQDSLRAGDVDGGVDDAQRHLGWLLVESDAQRRPDAARETLTRLGGPAARPTLAVDVGFEATAVQVGRLLTDPGLVDQAVRTAELRSTRNPSSDSLRFAALLASGLATGDLDALAAAVDGLERGSRPLLTMTAWEHLGLLHTGPDEHDRAVAAFHRALELAVRCGADADGQRLRQRLRARGVRTRVTTVPRPDTGWAALTPAERAVAGRVAAGLTNRATADALFISPNTVAAHLRHVFEKLQVHSRVELARIVAERESSTAGEDLV